MNEQAYRRALERLLRAAERATIQKKYRDTHEFDDLWEEMRKAEYLLNVTGDQ